MVQFTFWVTLCPSAYLGLFSLEHTRVNKSLSKY